jgi:hypothetical protein
MISPLQNAMINLPEKVGYCLDTAGQNLCTRFYSFCQDFFVRGSPALFLTNLLILYSCTYARHGGCLDIVIDPL